MANEWILKTYAGGAPQTTLNGAISGVATSITLTLGTGLPDGSAGSFVIALDFGSATEEKILCSARSGVTLTVTQRGYDGTTAQAHADLAVVAHVLDAYSINQVNTLANVMDVQGALAVRGSGNTYAKVALGTSGYPLLAGATAPAYGQVDTGGIKDVAVTTAKIAAAAVTATELAAAVAGAGLAGGAGTALSVNVDASSIEIATDTLQVKAAGVTAAMLAGSIPYTKLTGVLTNASGTNATVTVSTSAPTGGSAGDFWFKY